MMTEIQNIEGGWKDVSSLERTTFKKKIFNFKFLSNLNKSWLMFITSPNTKSFRSFRWCDEKFNPRNSHKFPIQNYW